MIPTIITYLVFAVLIIAAAVIDSQTLRIPNTLIVVLIALWAAWRVVLGVGNVMIGADFVTGLMAPQPSYGVSLADGIIGAVVLGGGLLLVTAAYEAITKKHAMGGGDIKLFAAVGLYVGVECGIIALLAACVVSLVLALTVPRARWGAMGIVTEEGSRQPLMRGMPFGPSIVIGVGIALVVMTIIR